MNPKYLSIFTLFLNIKNMNTSGNKINLIFSYIFHPENSESFKVFTKFS